MEGGGEGEGEFGGEGSGGRVCSIEGMRASAGTHSTGQTEYQIRIPDTEMIQYIADTLSQR